MATPTTTWRLRGHGYEFCNCAFGCGCNFGGFPNSTDGSCSALVGHEIVEGSCGSLVLCGVKWAVIVRWPKAIHEGHGTAVFIIDPEANDEQAEALAQIVTGTLGGMPWEILGTTFEVAGIERAPITIEGEGGTRVFRAGGLGEGRGSTFRNQVTGEEHLANVELPDGFIWKRGQCGVGSFHAKAGGLSLDFQNTNWFLYDYDWANAPIVAAAA